MKSVTHRVAAYHGMYVTIMHKRRKMMKASYPSGVIPVIVGKYDEYCVMLDS